MLRKLRSTTRTLSPSRCTRLRPASPRRSFTQHARALTARPTQLAGSHAWAARHFACEHASAQRACRSAWAGHATRSASLQRTLGRNAGRHAAGARAQVSKGTHEETGPSIRRRAVRSAFRSRFGSLAHCAGWGCSERPSACSAPAGPPKRCGCCSALNLPAANGGACGAPAAPHLGAADAHGLSPARATTPSSMSCWLWIATCRPTS